MPIADDVVLGSNVIIRHPSLVNLYGCRIGNDVKIGTFVEIQRGVVVGDRCKISSHSFLCEGVVIESEVFIGHGVMFTNDLYPRAASEGRLHTDVDWTVIPTTVRRGASIGSSAVILCGIVVGEHAMIGAGAVVVSDVPDFALMIGVPARNVGSVRDRAASADSQT